MFPAEDHSRTLWTVGHSNHPLGHFLDLLRQSAVEVIADSRSYPYSNYAVQFDQPALQDALARAGFQYVYLGRELGGRPEGPEYYDAEGHVLYDRVAASSFFHQGLTRLQEDASRFRLALLCAEENPAHCHRRLLVARVLLQRGFDVRHIRGDGRIQSDPEVAAENDPAAPQLALFETTEAPEWKSIPSVSRKNRRKSSSAF